MATPTDCYACARNADTGRLPPRELLAAGDLWRVAHAFAHVHFHIVPRPA